MTQATSFRDEDGQLDALPETTVTEANVDFPGTCVLDEAGAVRCLPGDPRVPDPPGSFETVKAAFYPAIFVPEEWYTL